LNWFLDLDEHQIKKVTDIVRIQGPLVLHDVRLNDILSSIARTFFKNVKNGRESTINRSIDGSTYPS
jgi:hypothetical protein